MIWDSRLRSAWPRETSRPGLRVLTPGRLSRPPSDGRARPLDRRRRFRRRLPGPGRRLVLTPVVGAASVEPPRVRLVDGLRAQSQQRQGEDQEQSDSIV